MIIFIRKLYFTKFISRYSAVNKIIIVGNIVVGGSGKTPFTIWLSNYLSNKKKKIAIVSSGYGSLAKEVSIITDDSSADKVGDEALLLKKSTSAEIVSSDNRIKSTKYIDNKKFDYIIHDDGLQHYKMKRDYEFIITKFNQDHNNFLLPCGPLREPKAFHSKNKYVLSNYYDSDFPGFHTKISKIRNGKNHKYYSFKDNLFNNSYLLTAIADSRELIKELHKNNLCFDKKIYPDHHNFTLKDIPDTTKPILVTEKDFTKLKEYNLDNIYILEQSVFPNDKLIEMIEKLV
ncbi:MAG: tetraacyldisaccharide 4'-kinase [Gammaproteobacteria bacterium]|nr:tetraacyldisaccharide 4'-kinase [Gammaproteobacteria bacterium]MBL6899150.1 tetraacyldisaccharide 4'-kinase [Gammaproteobacteria bacterium]